MTDIDTAAAADAIRAAVAQDAQTDTIPNQAPQATETVSPSGQETQSNQTDSTTDRPSGLFHDVDPESLTPEMRTIFDGMQKSYTQKNQELASMRKEYESLGAVDQVKSAVEFVQSLQDPNNLVQLHTELSTYLQDMGYSKAEADSAAANTLDNADTSFNDFESDSSTVDPAISQQLQELQSFKEQYEQEKLQSEIESSLSRQENIIRQSNPTYTDDDIQTVYQLSYAFGGDLLAAQKSYEGERQRILSAYAAQKSAVVEGVTSPTGSAHADAPSDLTDWKAATDYAKRRLAALDGLGALDN